MIDKTMTFMKFWGQTQLNNKFNLMGKCHLDDTKNLNNYSAIKVIKIYEISRKIA